jgi:sialate O-acetylesterase
MKKIAVLLPQLLFFCSVFANVTLPAVIGSNMVLQQQSADKIWGWGNPGEKVFVTTSWDNKTDSVVVSAGADWQLMLHTPAASNAPFTITIKGYNTIVLENVLVGEVWVCSGQSNMEMSYGWGLPDVGAELPTALNNSIRFFTVGKASSAYPQMDCKGKWVACDSNSLKTFSAAAYFFGKKLNKTLNIPIGLINTSWGGTAAEVWTPDSKIYSDAVLKAAAAKLKPSNGWPIAPGCLYNTMVAPLLNYNIAGSIWYQGESNTGTAASYSALLDTMISAWRASWGKNLPFYLVQIAPFKYGNNYNGALLEEQQAKVMAYPNTGMVVTNDLVTDTADIHPKDKHDVGYRLAGWALAETYHLQGIVYKSPTYKNLVVEKDKAIISFDNAESGLTAKSKAIGEVLIAGDDKIFYPAEAKIEGSKLIVSSKQVKQPVAVRYAFGNTALATLFNTDGLPVVPFRTDDWDASGAAWH